MCLFVNARLSDVHQRIDDRMEFDEELHEEVNIIVGLFEDTNYE